MTIRAAFAAILSRLSGSATPAPNHSLQRAAGASCGPVEGARPQPSTDGLGRLQTRRMALIEAAQKSRNLRRNKEASLIEAELRDVTAAILGRSA